MPWHPIPCSNYRWRFKLCFLPIDGASNGYHLSLRNLLLCRIFKVNIWNRNVYGQIGKREQWLSNYFIMSKILTLKRLGYFGSWKNGGGGGPKRPPSDLGRGSRDHRKNLHNGSVRCNLQDCIFRFSKIFFFYFILINYANLCEKSDFLREISK